MKRTLVHHLLSSQASMFQRVSFFDNRELEIKENYDSYTRSSEKVSC